MIKDVALASHDISEAGPASETPTSTIYTPPSEGSPYLGHPSLDPPPRRPSPLSLETRAAKPRASSSTGSANDRAQAEEELHSDLESGAEEDVMGERPPLHRPTDGRSQVPLLKDEERGRPSYESPNRSARPTFAARRSTFRSQNPDFEAQSATRKKYTYAAFFLGLSLVSFVVQTETAQYIQHTLGWDKAFCML
jgi:hypothetical protein